MPLELSPSLMRAIGWVGLCLSIVVAMAGGLWSTMVEPEDVWSEQQAAEFKAASEALHLAMTPETLTPEKSTQRRSSSLGSPAERRAAAEARFGEIRAELEAAQYANDRAGWVWLQVGLGGVACFAALIFLSRGNHDA